MGTITRPKSCRNLPRAAIETSWASDGPVRSGQHLQELFVAVDILAVQESGRAPRFHRDDILRPVVEEEDLLRLDRDLVALSQLLDDPLDRLFFGTPAQLREVEVFRQPERVEE